MARDLPFSSAALGHLANGSAYYDLGNAFSTEALHSRAALERLFKEGEYFIIRANIRRSTVNMTATRGPN